MTLSSGETLGSYKVISLLGAGGMGEVYLAKDVQLGRDVAIKVLSERILPTTISVHRGSISMDGPRDETQLAHFVREAQVLASLNHSKIATLFGFEQTDELSYLVMEFVDGETLSEMLRRGPMEIDHALQIFIQIAEGLEAAHNKGVVHCDLKPANIKINSDGSVKILDFGLARALAPENASESDPDMSPTLSYVSAQSEEVVGTVGYMSPEQARGKRIDKRTDLWSFGVCLFEALSGERPFQADTVSDTLVRILDREADFERLPPTTPWQVRELLRRLLSKDLGDRLRDAGDALLELRDALARRPAPAATVVEESARGDTTKWLVGLAVGAALGIMASFMLLSGGGGRSAGSSTRAPQRFSITLPAANPLQLSDELFRHRGAILSKDGRQIVYVGKSGGTNQLFRRAIDGVEPQPLEGTEDAWCPFFSPDDRWVGFFDRQEQKLEKVFLEGGLPEALADAVNPLGAAWGSDGFIIYSSGVQGLFRVSENGGEPELLATTPQDLLYVGWPELLPGTDTLLVNFGAATGPQGIHLGLLDPSSGGALTPLLDRGGIARFVPTGHLVYANRGELMAVPFDVSGLVLEGPVVKITEPRMGQLERGPSEWDFSDDGRLIYAAGDGNRAGRTAMWVGRDGAALDVLDLEVANLGWTRISPDGQTVVYTSVDASGNLDLYLYDHERGEDRRLTNDPAIDNNAIWSPDGKSIVFQSRRLGREGTLFSLDLASGAVEALLEEQKSQIPVSFSPDGELLFYSQGANEENRSDIWVLSLEDGSTRPLKEGAAIERLPRISPDGKWLAYESNESGRPEIYVEAFPESTGHMVVSTEGGRFPVWNPSGSELFFRVGQDVVSVAFEGGSPPRLGRPQVLFSGAFDDSDRSFDISADGELFLMLRSAEASAHELVVVENWFSRLNELPRSGRAPLADPL